MYQDIRYTNTSEIVEYFFLNNLILLLYFVLIRTLVIREIYFFHVNIFNWYQKLVHDSVTVLVKHYWWNKFSIFCQYFFDVLHGFLGKICWSRFYDLLLNFSCWFILDEDIYPIWNCDTYDPLIGYNNIFFDICYNKTNLYVKFKKIQWDIHWNFPLLWWLNHSISFLHME